MNQILLSLETFDPVTAIAPYLNSPRSIEACNRLGVSPEDLLYIPFEDFSKSSNEVNDVLKVKYDKLEKMRMHTYSNVLKEYEKICKEESPKKQKNKVSSNKERIINVSDDIHSTVLEMQAEKFRRIEQEEWKSFQRLLRLEIRNAEIERQSLKGNYDHVDWQRRKQELNMDFSRKLQELRKKQLLEKKQAEDNRLKEIHQEQAEFAERVKAMPDVRQRMRNDRERKQELENERNKRMEEARLAKQEILDGIESKMKLRKQEQDMKQKTIEDRLREATERKRKEDEIKRKQENDRLQKIKNDIQSAEEMKRIQLEKRLSEEEEKRLKIIEQRKAEKQRIFSGDELKEKVMLSRQKNEEILQSRANKILTDMEKKELGCKQELERLKEEQERRKGIRSAQLEAFHLNATRKKKAEEHRLKVLESKLQLKEEKTKAIQKGYNTLSNMAGKMRAIMLRATAELKGEMKSTNEPISSDLVIKKALSISDKMLFPQLERSFGLADKVSYNQRNDNMTESNSIKKEVLNESLEFPQGNFFSNFPSGLLDHSNVKGVNNNSNSNSNNNTEESIQALDKLFLNVSHAETNAKHQNTSHLTSSPALPIKSVSKSELIQSLERSKSIAINAVSPSITSKSKLSKSKSLNKSNSSEVEAFDPLPSIMKESNQEKFVLYKSNAVLPTTTSSQAINIISKLAPKKPAPSLIGFGVFKEDDISLVSKDSVPMNVKDSSRIASETPESEIVLDGNHESLQLERLRDDSTITSNQGVINQLTSEANQPIVDPNNFIDQLRKEHHDLLLQVIENEKQAEEERLKALKTIYDPDERKSLEAIFAEERRKASENIQNLTNNSTIEIKNAILALSGIHH